MWVAHAKLGKCLLMRKRLLKAKALTLGGAWFSARRCFLSGHCLVESDSLSLALAGAGVLCKKSEIPQ